MCIGVNKGYEDQCGRKIGEAKEERARRRGSRRTRKELPSVRGSCELEADGADLRTWKHQAEREARKKISEGLDRAQEAV